MGRSGGKSKRNDRLAECGYRRSGRDRCRSRRDRRRRLCPSEEERRIFYVGITRAINELELIKYKSLYGTPPEGQDFVDEVEKIVKGVSLSNAIKEGKAIKKDDRVRHGSYGDGTVVSNDGQTITISFDKGGKRKFVLTMVIQNGVVKKI